MSTRETGKSGQVSGDGVDGLITESLIALEGKIDAIPRA